MPKIGANSDLPGAAGMDARVISIELNFGGVVDGNVHDPIFNGGVVDINNSPDKVNPKFS